jgi:hypothetical protein
VRVLGKDEVTGSIPVGGSNFMNSELKPGESGMMECPYCAKCKHCGCHLPKSLATKKGNHEYCEQKAEG